MSADGTFLFRGLLTPTEVEGVAAALSAVDFVDGRRTAQGAARTVKNNQQLDTSHPVGKAQAAVLVAAMGRREDFKGASLPRTILPFLFARYGVGMGYGEHLDLPIVGTGGGPLRTDLSLTVFLSDPSTYDGGELIVPGPDGERGVKGAAGDAFLYPSDTLHRVAPVTRGTRLVAVTWIQSMVRDPEERAILVALGSALAGMATAGVPETDLLRVRAVQHRLVRRWAVC